MILTELVVSTSARNVNRTNNTVQTNKTFVFGYDWHSDPLKPEHKQ